MSNTEAGQINIRSSIFSVLSIALLIFTLACSMSVQYGHADTPVAATAKEIQPLIAGDVAPRFGVETVDHESFVFEPRDLERPVVLISFRGGWCPFCNMHLSELRDVIGNINALGVDVLFLSGDRPELLYQSLKEQTQQDISDLDYQILSDADAQAAIAFGIAFKAPQKAIEMRAVKGDDIVGSSMARHGVLPVPSVFAVDTDGIIAFAYSNADYKIRLPADELLAAARGMVATQ
jgi:peroxiredoxin